MKSDSTSSRKDNLINPYLPKFLEEKNFFIYVTFKWAFCKNNQYSFTGLDDRCWNGGEREHKSATELGRVRWHLGEL